MIKRIGGKLRYAVLLCVVLTSILFVMSGCGKRSPETSIPEEIRFDMEDQNGDMYNLGNYGDKTVIINLCATWAPECLPEMEALESIDNEHRDDLAVFGLMFPGINGETDRDGIVAFLQEHGIDYPILMDYEARMNDCYHFEGYPSTVVIRPGETTVTLGTVGYDDLLQLAGY